MLKTAKFLLALCAATIVSAANAAPFTNGDFSNGPGQFTVLYAGDNFTLPGWTVRSGTVEYLGSIFNFQNPLPGKNALDMDGISTGNIYQTFDTTAGSSYTVSFYLSGNPTQIPLKRLQVTADSVVQTYDFDTTGRSFTDLGWVLRSFDFTASSSSTTLEFQSLPTGSIGAGALIGVVSVTAQNSTSVPEPASLALFASALSMAGFAGLRRRR